MSEMPNLKAKYREEVAPALMQKFHYKSTMQIPRIEKVVVNVGCGEARDNAKMLDAVVRDLGVITGQKAIVTRAKKSVANFKVREGMPIGAKVTLRQDKMWEFLDRLFNVALPRVRDAVTTGARSAAVPTPTCVTTASAGSASGSWPTKARSPACGRLPGNLYGTAGPDAPTIRSAFP